MEEEAFQTLAFLKVIELSCQLSALSCCLAVWFLSESFGFFWILLESFGIFANLLDSFLYIWILLDSFETLWNNSVGRAF